VSVIIPTFNRGILLCEAIDSVLAQNFTDLEIVVVDDGSTDHTASLCQKFGNRIFYHPQQNRGVAAARNQGVRLARGEFICFLDSDDLWKPNKLEIQIAFADAHPEYGLIATEIASFDRQGIVSDRSKASMYKIANGMVIEDLLFSNWIQTSTVLVRAETLEVVGGFDEDVGQFGEDWLLWMRIASRFPVYFIPEPLVLYRIHQEKLTSRQPEIQYDGLIRIIAKLGCLPQFQSKPELLRLAEYRIAIGRGLQNLRSGACDLAVPKLRRACSLRRFPLAAASLLARAKIGCMLRSLRMRQEPT
jgi:glycosyltransferase involved in cell wall biosynthesis